MAITEAIVLTESEHTARLNRTWGRPSGFLGWFSTVHHTDIGIRYMVTAFVFFLLGGFLPG